MCGLQNSAGYGGVFSADRDAVAEASGVCGYLRAWLKVHSFEVWCIFLVCLVPVGGLFCGFCFVV